VFSEVRVSAFAPAIIVTLVFSLFAVVRNGAFEGCAAPSSL
jgi:hypothetical protein